MSTGKNNGLHPRLEIASPRVAMTALAYLANFLMWDTSSGAPSDGGANSGGFGGRRGAGGKRTLQQTRAIPLDDPRVDRVSHLAFDRHAPIGSRHCRLSVARRSVMSTVAARFPAPQQGACCASGNTNDLRTRRAQMSPPPRGTVSDGMVPPGQRRLPSRDPRWMTRPRTGCAALPLASRWHDPAASLNDAGSLVNPRTPIH